MPRKSVDLLEQNLGPAPRKRLKKMPHIGQVVYWHDPDHGVCSRWAVVTGVDGNDKDDIITIDYGTEVFLHELS